ncbi:MAG: MMPL family transporter [Actinomycetales bacterium]
MSTSTDSASTGSSSSGSSSSGSSRGPRPGLSTRRPSAWLRWVLPAALVVVWLALGGIAGPYSGKLGEVQKNDNSSFLPASAESTRAGELAAQFRQTETLPTFIVVEGSQQEISQVQDDVRQLASQIPSLPLESSKGGTAGDRTVGDFLPPAPPTVVPSKDGKALLVPLPIDSKTATEALPDGSLPLVDVVQTVRDRMHAELGPLGVDSYVTGVGGQSADAVKAFGGLDSILLLVALGVVFVILLVVYRSPLLPILVLLSAGFGLGLASFVVYLLADGGVLTLSGQSQGILSILVVGAATDYSLLLVSRYREELRRHENRADAMLTALKRAAEPIIASAVTVALGVLCLLASGLNSNRSLGPVAAIGIVCALAAAITFLPAVLTLLGRAAFWPFRPKFGSAVVEHGGIWGRIADAVARRPRRIWVTAVAVLLVLAAFLPTFRGSGTSASDIFLNPTESVQGQDALARHFPAGSGSPAVIVAPASAVDSVVRVASQTEGVQSAAPVTAPGGSAPRVENGLVEVQATLADGPDTPAAEDTVLRLRDRLDSVSKEALVGGPTAQQLDVRETSAHDLRVIIPLVLVVVFIVLALLLRALVAPLLLVAANVLSFAATLGASAIAFNHIFGFAGADPAVPLYSFVFLVALGVDYSIFLMTRVREETKHVGTAQGVDNGLAVTGGVITSAGIVLAATFGALAVVPILFLVEIAFIVAFGVLLDTLIVRSLIVPALSLEIGGRIWWPSKLR